MSALGTGAVCCGEREGCEVTDCELALPVLAPPPSITPVVDPAPANDIDFDPEEDDE